MLSNTHSQFEKDIQQELLTKYEKFIKYQALMLNVLNDFHRVCEKYNIQYFLAYGSLLGAIRDNGQIPWDYDIDTWVRFEDKEKLFSALEQDLNKEYYFVCHYYKKSAYHRMLRISPKGYNSEVLHVDIFWLSGAPTVAEVNKKNFALLAKIRRISLYKHLDFKFISYNQSRTICMYSKMVSFCCKMIPDFLLDSVYNKKVSIPSRSSVMLCDGDTLYVESSLFDEPELITLANGMQFHVPKKYDKLLTLLYGNYRCYLPIANRIKEFLNSLDRIETLGKI